MSRDESVKFLGKIGAVAESEEEAKENDLGI